MKTAAKRVPWSSGEISTLIYGILRLGERDFSDMISQSVFIKREHEIKLSKSTQSGPMALSTKIRRTPEDIAKTWASIKAMRSLDMARLSGSD